MVMVLIDQMDPEEKEKMEKRDWLAEKIQMLNTQLEGFEADVEKAVSMMSVFFCHAAIMNTARLVVVYRSIHL